MESSRRKPKPASSSPAAEIPDVPAVEIPLAASAEQRIREVLAETDANVVDLARRMGPEVLAFLRDVMQNSWKKLGMDKAISTQNRLAAADLVRKYSAIPTNVDLSLKAPPTIVYTGQPRVIPALSQVTVVGEITQDVEQIAERIVDVED